ncbi:BolA family transcriptional regulator [bacterium]|nr:BolA family transcriptional regulator [bacterium]
MPMDLTVVKNMIEQALPGSQVTINDLVGDGDHLQAIVVSDLFKGKMLIAQHQMVLNPLREKLKGELHALTLKTYTTEEFEKFKKG